MRSLLLVLCGFVIAVAAFAQTDRGSITGTVSDPAGAVIPSAPLKARNIGTGVTYEAASSNTGNYTLVQLPAGAYELSVTVSGFKTYVRAGLQVEVAQTLLVDQAHFPRATFASTAPLPTRPTTAWRGRTQPMRPCPAFQRRTNPASTPSWKWRFKPATSRPNTVKWAGVC